MLADLGVGASAAFRAASRHHQRASARLQIMGLALTAVWRSTLISEHRQGHLPNLGADRNALANAAMAAGIPLIEATSSASADASDEVASLGVAVGSMKRLLGELAVELAGKAVRSLPKLLTSSERAGCAGCPQGRR